MSKSILKYEGIQWSFPLFFECESVYATLYKSCKDFGIELPQAFMYGAPGTIWTGGRMSIARNRFDRGTLLRIMNYVYEANAVPTFTFSCTNIKEEDLEDQYANFVLDTALEANARFIVFSDLLKDYIKSKKSNATVVASVVKPYVEFQGPTRKQEMTVENETAYYNKLLKEYDIVVVRPEYSMGPLQENPNLLDDISRIEVLINQTCASNCERAYAHYKLIENSHREVNNEAAAHFECVRAHIPHSIGIKDSLIHSEEQIQNLINAGCKHLKVKGRGEYMYSMDALMLILAGQMFNQDGPGYFIMRDCAGRRFRSELEYFNRTVFPQVQNQMQPQMIGQNPEQNNNAMV